MRGHDSRQSLALFFALSLFLSLAQGESTKNVHRDPLSKRSTIFDSAHFRNHVTSFAMSVHTWPCLFSLGLNFFRFHSFEYSVCAIISKSSLCIFNRSIARICFEILKVFFFSDYFVCFWFLLCVFENSSFFFSELNWKSGFWVKSWNNYSFFVLLMTFFVWLNSWTIVRNSFCVTQKRKKYFKDVFHWDPNNGANNDSEWVVDWLKRIHNESHRYSWVETDTISYPTRFLFSNLYNFFHYNNFF